jgi:SAM-dependent methyltransferase
VEETEFDPRARVRKIASEHYKKGDALGWFEALYKEADGNNEIIPWADLEPNRYLRSWAEANDLAGNGRKALVVGCGLGDDARYLDDLGFNVTGFDISPTAIEWAKRIHSDRDIRFELMDLFHPFRRWLGAFEFVLEVYTIQPLPISMREKTIDSIAAFVAPGGELLVVNRGREDDDELDELPWPVSRKELEGFEQAGLEQVDFEVMLDESEDEPAPRFVLRYKRPA